MLHWQGGLGEPGPVTREEGAHGPRDSQVGLPGFLWGDGSIASPPSRGEWFGESRLERPWGTGRSGGVGLLQAESSQPCTVGHGGGGWGCISRRVLVLKTVSVLSWEEHVVLNNLVSAKDNFVFFKLKKK